jgi:hypothetical protein
MAMRFRTPMVMLLLVAACAPREIATARCTNTVLSVHDEWTCTVTGAVVGQFNAVEFDTESRNKVAQVSFTLQVTKGSVRVRYADLSGSQQIVVTPSEPANVNMKTKMSDRRSFTLSFEPVNGKAEGLTGTVKYSTP